MKSIVSICWLSTKGKLLALDHVNNDNGNG